MKRMNGGLSYIMRQAFCNASIRRNYHCSRVSRNKLLTSRSDIGHARMLCPIILVGIDS